MKTFERMADLFALAGGAVLLSIVLVTTTNAGAFILDRVARLFGTNVPALPGYEDFVRLAISCAVLTMFPLCQVRSGHVWVDLFTARLPKRAINLLDLLWQLLTVGLAGFLAWWMGVGLLQQRDDDAVSGVLGWPVWLFYGPGVLSLLLWGAIALMQAARRMRDVRA